MSPQAGPSSKRKSSTKKSAPPPKPLQLSKETIASDEDEDDEADKKSSDEADDSPDSEGDIEGVEPRRRANGVEGSGALPTTGKRLAYVITEFDITDLLQTLRSPTRDETYHSLDEFRDFGV